METQNYQKSKQKLMELKYYYIKWKNVNRKIIYNQIKVIRILISENIKTIQTKKCITRIKILIAFNGVTVFTSLSLTGVEIRIGVPIARYTSFLVSAATMIIANILQNWN